MNEVERKLERNIVATCLMTAAVFLCLPTPSAAQDKPFKFEITPFAAY